MSQNVKHEEVRKFFQLENDSQEFYGFYHRPKAEGRYPALIICHGLGGNKIGQGRIYVALAMKLAEIGIATFRFDCRGSGDSYGSLKDVDFTGLCTDVKKVMEFARSQDFVDGGKLGILGSSMGALVAVSVTHSQKDLKAIVLWNGLANVLEWQGSPIAQAMQSESQFIEIHDRQLISKTLAGQLFQQRGEQMMKELNEVPLLLIHGDADEIVPYHHCEQYLAARTVEAKTEFLRIPGMPHSYNQPEFRKSMLEKTLSFLQEVLS